MLSSSPNRTASSEAPDAASSEAPDAASSEAPDAASAVATVAVASVPVAPPPRYTSADIAWHTEAGRRANNEDSCAFQIAPGGEAALVVVADGMGGHASGEVASRLAVDRLLEACARDGFRPSGEGLARTLKTIHHEILRQSGQDPALHGMGTTLVAALLHADGLLIGHVGDSRALQFRGVLVRRLTRDHLYVVEALNVPENRAKEHPQGHMLSQALGASGEVAPDVAHFDAHPGDIIMLCTDGVAECLPEPQMHAVLQGEDLSACAAVLVRRALENGSRDNCTVALARVPLPKSDGSASPIADPRPESVFDDVQVSNPPSISAESDASAPLSAPKEDA